MNASEPIRRLARIAPDGIAFANAHGQSVTFAQFDFVLSERSRTNEKLQSVVIRPVAFRGGTGAIGGKITEEARESPIRATRLRNCKARRASP